MTREYPTLKMLRAGLTLKLGGFQFKMAKGKIQAGDLFVGEKDGPAQLLTAKKVVMKPEGKKIVIDRIHPHSTAKIFEGHECVKVEGAC